MPPVCFGKDDASANRLLESELRVASNTKFGAALALSNRRRWLVSECGNKEVNHDSHFCRRSSFGDRADLMHKLRLTIVKETNVQISWILVMAPIHVLLATLLISGPMTVGASRR